MIQKNAQLPRRTGGGCMEPTISIRRTVKDPVCGKEVTEGHARGWDYLYEGTLYYFCGPNCRNRFQTDPKGSLQSGPGQLQSVSAPEIDREKKTWQSTFGGFFKRS